MTLITVLMSCVATLAASRANRAVGGMRLFAFGLSSLGLGSIIGLLVSVAKDDEIAGMVASTIFRFGGVFMIAQSIRLFRGFATWPKSLIGAFAGTVAVFFFYWLYTRDSVGMRLGVMSSATAILAADSAVSMLRRVARRDRLTHWATGLVFAFVAVYMAVRGITDLSGAWHANSFSPFPVEIIATVCANVALIGAAFGMLLASNARLRQAAERSALFDPLTRLPNRRLFQDRLIEAEARVRTTGRRLGVIYLDLDDFKLINDTLGHQAGDELLRSVSGAMARILRPGDCLARVGGDEFVVLVEDVEHRSQLDSLAGRLMTAIKTGSESGIVMRASCGTAIFPDDGTSAQDVMREADMGMYQAKRRNRTSAGSSRARAAG